MVTFSEKIILWYLPTALGFQSLMLCSNSMMMQAKRSYHLFKDLHQLKAFIKCE